ncbi:MAG: tRNA lysidine(34) synthetase TilS, partial [Pontibacterium sp.]
AAKRFAIAEQTLSHYLDAHLQTLVGHQGELAIAGLSALTQGHQQLMLRHWLSTHTHVLPSEAWTNNLQAQMLAARDKTVCCALTNGEVRRFQNALYWVANTQTSPLHSLAPDVGNMDLGDGTLQVVERSTLSDEADKALGLKQLDGLVITRRKGGEVIRLAHTGQQRKVKKILQEAGIPPWLRDTWPLVFCGDTLVAIPNIAIAQGWEVKNGGYGLIWRSR